MVTVRGKVAATSGWWVTTTIVVPSSSPSSWTSPMTASRSSWESWLVGSSASSSCGRGGDRAGQGQALALAARHRGDDLVGHALEAHPGQQVGLGDGRAALGPASASRAKAMFWRAVA